MSKATIMKFSKSFLLGLSGVMTIATTPTLAQSTPDYKVSYRCDIDGAVPVTVAYNPVNKQQKPFKIITWKQENIDSQNITQDCEKAAEKLRAGLDLKSATEADMYLAVQSRAVKRRNSQNQMALYSVCLVGKRGASCRKNPDNLLVRIKVKAELSEQKQQEYLSSIINPEFAELDVEGTRTVGVTYPKIRSRTFWNRLFGLKI
jgi:hypothetical protein